MTRKLIMKLFGKRQLPTVKRELAPHINFKVECQSLPEEVYTTLWLDATEPKVTTTIKCPVCYQLYKLRIKATDTVGHRYRAGSRHHFQIIAIERETTERDY